MQHELSESAALFELAYSVAGFRVQTNRRVLDLEPSAFEIASVTVLFGNFGSSQKAFLLESRHAGDWHRLPGKFPPAAFVCDNGRLCLVSESGFAYLDYARQIRRVIPFASALQGRVILHASAIRYGEGVCAFIGASGTGKSTVAEQLRTEGLEMLSDDLLPCVTSNGRVTVAIASKHLDATPLPLKVIFFLNRNETLREPYCTRLTRRRCLQELLRNGFGELCVQRAWANQFEVYHRIAMKVPAFHLDFPNDRSSFQEWGQWLVANDFFLHGRPLTKTSSCHTGVH